MPEISDRSSIFGLWYSKMPQHKTIIVKSFFHDFLWCNISSYQIFICHFGRIFDQKPQFFLYFLSFWPYFQIWVLYMHIISYQHSYDIIGQKSSIGQKFLPPRAPLLWQKNEENGTYLLVFLLIFQSFNKCCRFKARGVAEISVRSMIFGICC